MLSDSALMDCDFDKNEQGKQECFWCGYVCPVCSAVPLRRNCPKALPDEAVDTVANVTESIEERTTICDRCEDWDVKKNSAATCKAVAEIPAA